MQQRRAQDWKDKKLQNKSGGSNASAKGGGDAYAKDKRCHGCGRAEHLVRNCPLKSHPDFNSEHVAWSESTNGKAWAAKSGKYGPYKSLPDGKTLSGDAIERMLPKTGGSKGKLMSHVQCYECHVCASVSDVTEMLPRNEKGLVGECTASVVKAARAKFTALPSNLLSVGVLSPHDSNSMIPIPHAICCILDSGAKEGSNSFLRGNYVSTKLREELEAHGVKSASPVHARVCSCMGGCQVVSDVMDVSFVVHNYITGVVF